ncbi:MULTISPECIES: hypothetical protein [unclassified Paenibacillus]|uniref:hypothetical protein n=1 Tax=unclassified Paenibacillus TaxID=185978 RepID=UPI00277FAB67|nr:MULTISPECIES: hypothetical protein [unclassified Paenibacillus]MDQ0896409.1 hypothetical protein [Paenibacillus sp. V4I7]MDQ0914047.1 hypothetical protein [Paenibacillus sp. V4I5]
MIKASAMEPKGSLPAEVQELCRKLNMNPEETISHALSLLNVSLQLQEQGYQIQARRKIGFWIREVRNILLIRR